jgi:hypothetical protein
MFHHSNYRFSRHSPLVTLDDAPRERKSDARTFKLPRGESLYLMNDQRDMLAEFTQKIMLSGTEAVRGSTRCQDYTKDLAFNQQ